MNEEINKLDTEKRNHRTENLSNLSTKEMVEKINYEDSLVAQAVSEKTSEIASLVDLTYDKIKNHFGRLIYIGAGTSGRIGILDASEIYPTFGVKDKVIGLIAGGKEAIQTPMEGAEDNKEEAIVELKKINFSKNDVLVGITASGRTPYVISALEYAKEIGAKTGFICNSLNSKGSKIADIAIEIETGPEAVTGSTRMKAGTAQKMVCNMISTCTMIKLGFVEKNYMINLVPTNLKLEERCKNMIREISGKDYQTVEKYFNESKNVRIALTMIEQNISYDQALKIYKEKYGIK